MSCWRRDSPDNRGAAYGALGEYERAITDFTGALRLDPQDAIACYNRGLVNAAMGQHEPAIADFRRVLGISADPALRQAAEEQLWQLGVEP